MRGAHVMESLGARRSWGLAHPFCPGDIMLKGLDHIILGIDDLERGVAWVERRTGVRAIFGGVHPGRGTANAVMALGPSSYLEIIAPDPQQASPTWFTQILTFHEPRLIAWAVHTPDIAALAQAAVSAGISIDGPHDGARARPDGKILTWKLFRFRDARSGLLPFFIEWSPDSLHPAQDAPPGCHLEHFHLQSPDAPELARVFQTMAVEVSVEPGKDPRSARASRAPKAMWNSRPKINKDRARAARSPHARAWVVSWFGRNAAILAAPVPAGSRRYGPN